MAKNTKDLKPEDLEDVDTEESSVLEHRDYAMPLRIMGYDYGGYKKQYDDNAKKYTTSKI